MNISQEFQNTTKRESFYAGLLHTLALILKVMVTTESEEERKRIQKETVDYCNRLIERYLS